MIEQFSKLSLGTQDLVLSQLSDSQLPINLVSTAKIKKIDSIFLINFKSFGKRYIGPFLNFTSIIGPNGSGKSNILDAMMFCFCSETSRHSLLDVRQLINRQGKQNFKDLMKQNKVCSVSICFILADNSKFTIQRTLDPEGKQQFQLNHQKVSRKIYQNILLRKGINTGTPNYAIWQGQIDRLLLKSPMQLTALFQNLSGSIYYKKTYDEIKHKLDQLQKEYEQKMKIINKLKIDKKNAKNAKRSNQQLNKLEEAYNEVMKKLYLLRVLQKQSGLVEQQKQLQKMRNKEEQKVKQINQKKIAYQKSHQQKQQLQTQLGRISQKLSKLQDILRKVDNPANILYLQQLKQQNTELYSLKQQITDLQTRKNFIMQNMPQIPSSQLIQQYLQVYEQWQQENSALNRQYIRRNNQLLFVEGMLNNKRELLAQFDKKIQKFNKNRNQQKQSLKQHNNSLQQIQNSIRQIQKQQINMKNSQNKLLKEKEQKLHELQKIISNIDDLQIIISEQSSTKKQAQLLKHLSSITQFYGILQDKVQPIANKYEIVFELLFSQINKQLLVQNQKSSRQVGDRLKEMNIMKTVVILDNVISHANNDRQKSQLTNEIRKRIGRNGQLAIDCIEYDQRLVGFKEYLSQFLYGKVVCDNINTAYEIRDKKIEGIRQIYTVDGNTVRLDGTISTHGNPESLKKAHRYQKNKSNVFQDLSKLTKQKQKIEMEISKIDKAANSSQQLISEINRLQVKKYEISKRIKQIQQNQSLKQPKPSQHQIAQISQLQKKKQKLGKELGDLDRMMRQSKIFDKFMKKNKIDNLNAFRVANNFQQIEKIMKKKNQMNKQMALIQSELSKLEQKLEKKHRKIEKMDQKISELPQKADKKQIQKEIKQNQAAILQIKERLAKISTFTSRQSLYFQSSVPTLQARLQYAKMKINKQLQEAADQYGVKFQYPIEEEQLRKQLNLPKKRKLTSNDFEDIHEDLTSQKNRIQENMNRYNTVTFMHHKSDDKTEEVIQQKIDSITEDIDKIRQLRSGHSQEIQQIRKDRSAVLINFIQSLKKNLQNSYHILTEMDNGLEGTIDLHIENTDYPFEYGMYYSPTPPTKRFVYDLQQLSGGQKSIASMALQYSLALATGVPFLILDETDAFLDANNVGRFLKLIQYSLQSKSMQMIIVSHKQALFSQSQSLIGVSRPKSNALSQAFSLKLIQN